MLKNKMHLPEATLHTSLRLVFRQCIFNRNLFYLTAIELKNEKSFNILSSIPSQVNLF